MTVPASTTCKSCRFYRLDRLFFGRHVNEGLGHCQFDAHHGKSVMRPANHTCARYDATERRKAYLAAQALRETAHG